MQAYRTWLGFYKGSMKLCRWNPEKLVQAANKYAASLGELLNSRFDAFQLQSLEFLPCSCLQRPFAAATFMVCFADVDIDFRHQTHRL